MFRKARRDGFESEIWDTKTKKTMIVTFVFFATGMLLAWQFGQIHGEAGERPADVRARETQFWNRIQYLNPGYPVDLRADATEMGWRVCTKLEAGWSPTRVLSFISQTNESAASKLPTPASQVLFWVGLEQSAVLSLCPDQAGKLEGWMENLEPKPPAIPEEA